MLVHAYATLPGKAKCSGPHHTIKMLHFVLFHSVTWYTYSIASRIHVNTAKLRNIACTLVATCVILRSLECISWPTWFKCARDRSSQRRFMFCMYAYNCLPLLKHLRVVCGEREREEIIGYERTSHPSNIKIRSPIDLLLIHLE